MDIVEQLRDDTKYCQCSFMDIYKPIEMEAADEIVLLREEVDHLHKMTIEWTKLHMENVKEIRRMRGALKNFCDSYQPHLQPERCQHCSEAYWAAREALEEKNDGHC